MATLAIDEEGLRQVLVKQVFVAPYGFRLHAFAENECTLEVPFRDSFRRPGGVVNGPVFVAAADVSMWLAVMTRIGRDEGERTVTAEMKTSFLKSARGTFLCKARIMKLGRRLIYGVAECTDGTGELLAHHTLTYIRPG